MPKEKRHVIQNSDAAWQSYECWLETLLQKSKNDWNDTQKYWSWTYFWHENEVEILTE